MSDNILPLKRQAQPSVVTEDGAALEFVERYCERLRFNHSDQCWYFFDGATWRKDDKRRVLEMARDIARELSGNEWKDGAKQRIGKTAFAFGVERAAQCDSRIAITSADFDCDPLLLGTPDGMVDLRTGELREPDPAEFISKTTVVAPAASDECPNWKSFLAEVTGGDPGVIEFIRRWFGYCLTGDVREQKFLFLHGDGGNGKGVLLNIVRWLSGGYAANAAMDTFVAAYGDRHPADLAALAGARIVTASETQTGREWDDVRIKTATGGDPITAAHKHRNPFTFAPTFKLTFSGNAKPDLRRVNHAMRRRVLIVEFGFKPSAPNLGLEAVLREEGPAILRWLIGGAVDWLKSGLEVPKAVANASAAYFREQDVLGRWIDEELVFSPGNDAIRTPSKVLWASWKHFAEENGRSVGRPNELARELVRRGARDYRGRERGFTGVSVRSENDAC